MFTAFKLAWLIVRRASTAHLILKTFTLGVLGIQLSYPKLYQFVLINAKYLSMTVEGKQVCLLEYITNPEYQDELANTDADIYLYKPQKIYLNYIH